MDAENLAIVFRGGERLGIVAAAALCIWLGYKLFQSLPAQHGSGGTLTLPSAKLVMSKVGPGVFFALFGALVLWEAVQFQLKAGPVTVAATATAGLAEGRQIILAAASADPQALIYAQNDISVLNCLAGFAPDELGPGEAERVLHKARVALLAPAWQPGWGDAAFAALQRGQIPASGPVADIYRARHNACPPAGGPKAMTAMIGRRALLGGCGGLIVLAATRARGQQPRLGPYTGKALEAVRGTYEPYVRGVFREDLIARLPPAMRGPLGEVALDIPVEMPGTDPAFVLSVASFPARRQVVLPLRTAVWLEEYCALTAYFEKRQCPDRLTISLLYDAKLAIGGQDGVRPPGPLAAFGLDDSVYDDAFVKDLSNKLYASTVFFLLAHELGHIARGHAGGVTGIHSQMQEREADAYAFDAMATVGVAPLGLAYFFTAAAMMEGSQMTHPLSGSRAEAAALALEARPRAFVDRGEPDPDAWVPRLLDNARQLRAAIPLIDDAAQRAGMLGLAGRISFGDLRSMHEKLCPP